jgi:hypothetical protein
MRDKILNRWSPRLRRTTLIYAVVSLFLAIGSIWAAGQNWVAYALDAEPSCEYIVAPATIEATDTGAITVVDSACFSGWELASAAASNAGISQSTWAPDYWIPVTSGIPSLSLLTAITALLAAAGLWLRNAIFGGLALLPAFMAMGTWSTTLSAVAGGLSSAQFTVQFGLMAAGGLFIVSAIIALAGIFLVAMNNNRYRKQILTETSGKESLGIVNDLRVFARTGFNQNKNSSATETV